MLLAQAMLSFIFTRNLNFQRQPRVPATHPSRSLYEEELMGLMGYLGEVIKVRSGDSMRITLQVHPKGYKMCVDVCEQLSLQIRYSQVSRIWE